MRRKNVVVGAMAAAMVAFSPTILVLPAKAAANDYTAPFTGASCKVGVVGDIAGSSASVDRAKEVRAMMDLNGVSHYVLPGDLAYGNHTADEADSYFIPVYGKGNAAKVRPSPGNHEWSTDNASGYYNHTFPGIPKHYAYDACGWRMISVDGEKTGDIANAAAFIRSENAKDPNQPTFIQYHKPRWSSNSHHRSDSIVEPLWKAAADTKAAVVVNGHVHAYERFSAMGATGQPTAGGVTQFIIGTGGRQAYSDWGTTVPGSAKQIGGVYGAGIFTLTPDGKWAMQFKDRSNVALDSASGTSATVPRPTPTPTATSTPTPTATPTATPPPAARTLTFAPVADAQEQRDTPTQNYGSFPKLIVDAPVNGVDEFESHLKFNVTGLRGAPISATLRLFATGPSVQGPEVYSTGNGWTESGITWSNKPARTSGKLDDGGNVSINTWIELDVTAAVKANGEHSFNLNGPSTDGTIMVSREGAKANRPQLVIKTAGGATATPSPTSKPTAPSSIATPTATPSPTPSPSPSAPANQTKAALVGLIQDVTTAGGYVYTAKDSAGNTMDTVKVIDNPSGGYLAVYHSGNVVRLATSTNMTTWTYRATLDPAASQPTIRALPTGGFITGAEYNGGNGGQLRIRYYANQAALYAGAADKTFTTLRSLSPCNEGTPSFDSVTLSPDIKTSVIKVGMHHHECDTAADTDRQSLGTLTNFSSWSAVKQPTISQALIDAAAAAGKTVDGNIGDRDTLTWGGVKYGIHEVQYNKGATGQNNSFASWRPYLYDHAANSARLLAMKTHRGSTAFANPSYSLVKDPHGRPAIVVGVFIPVEGAGTNEAGPLIYWKTLPA